MDEFALIAELLAPLSNGAPNAFGLTDDAALISPSPGHHLVVSKAMIVAGVHGRHGGDAACLSLGAGSAEGGR